ncbi:MAG: hypothetical protein GX575_04475 [Candidatus Anammoximicrobium sp.]|nr:hypothetical protein [Candidatus Anammoximicrobium sp.]
MKRRFAEQILCGCVLIAAAFASSPCVACPFCTASAQTISEEMASLDAAVVARLVKLPDAVKTPVAGGDAPKAVFQVTHVLKDTAGTKEKQEIEAVIYGEQQVGDRFLVMGAGRPDVAWKTPKKVSDRAVEYLRQLDRLPEKGPERLVFFQDYLQDEDLLLAGDAYEEFARAPYSELQGLRDKIDRARLLGWIKDPDTLLNRKRLYLILLSVCGGADDLPMLEQLLRTEDRKARAGLDALVGSYLMLAGADGVALVEDLLLRNSQADYADTYAAIMALRFLGTETEVVPRPRLLQAFHCLLERPDLADLIIPDLARWEDWSQVERMVRLFKEADKSSKEVRVAIINYLRSCPQPEAKAHAAELAKLDPVAAKRAEIFFPFGGGTGAASASSPSAATPGSLLAPTQAETPTGPAPGDTAVNAPHGSSGKVPILHRTATADLNPLTYLVVFWILGGVFFVAQWAILIGWGRGA